MSDPSRFWAGRVERRHYLLDVAAQDGVYPLLIRGVRSKDDPLLVERG
jgi:hypothetical protein